MAAPVNTFRTSAAIGNREDLIDTIYDISPTETPFMTMIGRSKATAINHEWQTDDLKTPGKNAKPEGDTFASIAVRPTKRIGNTCQILSAGFTVSKTQDAVSKAGRKSETQYQLAKTAKELKLDLEFALLNNTVKAIADPREMRGLEGWTTSNNSLGAGGIAPNADANTAATDGTQRAVTIALLEEVTQKIYINGGTPKVIMAGTKNRAAISKVATGVTKMEMAEEKKITTTVDIWYSDYGALKIVPNRIQRDRTVFIFDPEMASVAYLRPFATEEMAKLADGTSKHIIVESTLRINNEKAFGAVRDLIV